MKIKYTIVRPGAQAPQYATEGAAGSDLRACLPEPVTLAPGETYLVPIGISMEIPAGYVGLVYARSGLATRRGLAPANKVGVIDSDYRGEFFVPIHNHSGAAAVIEPGERIAQLITTPIVTPVFEEAERLSDTGRGDRGFGSTGTA